MSESETTGLSNQRGSSGVRSPAFSGVEGFRLPTLGPINDDTVVTDPVNGYAYRNNPTFADNADRIQVMICYRSLWLYGRVAVAANGSAAITGSAVADVYDNFWTEVYGLLHQMAQKRDGYKATTDSLTDAQNLMWRDQLIMNIKVNVRILWTLYHATLVNSGLRSMITGFAGLRARIQRALEASNTLIYPQGLDAIIDYWSEVYSPYLGGPVIVNYMDPQYVVRNGGGSLQASVGTFTNWVALPDWTSAADVAALVNDIEVALGILTRYDCNVAADATDLKLIDSIYAMMGFPTPQTGVRGVTVNPGKFYEQFKRYGFLYEDNKGGGVDTWVYWPDCNGSVEQLLNIPIGGYPFDELDMIGAKGIYAWDADDDATPGYTAAANDLSGYGMCAPSSFLNADEGLANVMAVDFYTEEDGWAEQAKELDYTAAAGLQAHL